MNRLGFALVTPLFGSVATRNRKSFFPPYIALGGVIACLTLLCFLSAACGLTSAQPADPPITIATTSLPNGSVGVAYGATLTATGGVPPYTWSLAAGLLPTGLALSSSGVISGTPTVAGSYSFTIQLTGKPGQKASQMFTVTIAAAQVAPSITTQPASQTVTVGQTATFSVIATGTVPLGYQWNKNGTAVSGATSSSYTTPATALSDNGAQFTVVVSDIAGSAASNPATLTVNGQPQISAVPTSVSFGNIAVGATNTQSIGLTNSGTASLSISQATVTGVGFSTSGLTLPLTLTVGQSSSFSVRFAPAATGSVTGSVSLVSNAPNSPTAIALSGTGVQPQLSVTPTSVSFGSVVVGTTNTQTVTLTNSGSASLTLSQATVTGTGFSLSGLTVPLTLAVGQTTNFNVAFAPASASSVTGSVSLVSNAPNSPATIALSGTGVAATFQLTASPTSLSFGNVLVGSSSTQSVTLTNTGNSSVSVSQISVLGTGLSTTGLTLPVTLAAGQSASLSVVFAPTVAGSVTGSVSVVSTATNSPATITLSGSGITSTSGLLCGQLDDGLIHTPPNYTTPLAPPAKGASYVDPQYGCTITRLTNGVADNLGAAAHHDYGTITPVNANDTYVMILLENGSLEIVDTTGNVIVPAANMPGTSSANVPWDTSVPTRFYYARGAAISRGDITGLPNCASTHNCTVTSTTLHDFSGTYAAVQIPDQEDISDDGDHLWLVGDTSAFLYTISSNTVGPTMNVGTKDSGWHKIQIMPSNRMLMTWSPNGPGPGAGQEVYNTNATLAWHMFDNTIHTDCGTDLSGNEVCVAARIPDLGGNINMANACPTFTGTQDGGVDIVNLSTHAAQCLVDVNWADTEISFRDGKTGAGWVFITFFKAGTCPTYSCFDTTSPSHLSSTWATDWVHFAEEGLLVRIDSNNSTNKNRLFHTRSRSTEYYWAIPRGAVSRDGKYLVFDTNFDISNTGLVNYTDVYLVKVQ